MFNAFIEKTPKQDLFEDASLCATLSKEGTDEGYYREKCDHTFEPLRNDYDCSVLEGPNNKKNSFYLR